MPIQPFDLTGSSAGRALGKAAQRLAAARIADLHDEPGRLDALRLKACGISVSTANQSLDLDAFKRLQSLADEAGIERARAAQFSGEKINATEGRAVLHMALRASKGDRFQVDGSDVMPDVLATRRAFLGFAESVRTEGQFDHVVNIGIGGSDLGPLMLHEALAPHRLASNKSAPSISFVSNVDPFHLAQALHGKDPARTLFVVVSKTFTTQETMANAQAAKQWIVDALGLEAVSRHFSAVSSNVEAAVAFGVPPERIFGFADWVGGRFSVWGPVGLSVALGSGAAAFEELLAGARAMDQHFQKTALSENLPVQLALVGVWNASFLNHPTRAVLPYAQALHRLPAYLQQAEMESNGKSVGRDGSALSHHTSPVVWGEPGTNGQHAFHQLLHQGTAIHPADFVAVASPMAETQINDSRHQFLVANAIAQADSLMRGRPAAEDPHRQFPGNRPSTFILLEDLSPSSIGALVALFEHKIFVEGVLWNTHSFDQWGVELGKVAAGQVFHEMSTSGLPVDRYVP